MQKVYFVSLNVLLDYPNAITSLNGKADSQNSSNRVYISSGTFSRLVQIVDGGGKDAPNAAVVLTYIKDKALEVFKPDSENMDICMAVKEFNNSPCDGCKEAVWISNSVADKAIATVNKLLCEEYKDSIPILTDSELTKGYILKDLAEVDVADIPDNTFILDSTNKLHFHARGVGQGSITPRSHAPTLWGETIRPRSIYQEMVMHAFQEPHLNMISIQSPAGLGKSFLALAHATEEVFQKKNYKSIVVIKSTVELGQAMGFLPGEMNDKVGPYFNSIMGIMEHLHKLRNIPSKYVVDDSDLFALSNAKFKITPINFLRGENIEDAVVIIDEMQNFKRNEARTILTRMGRNTKVICVGDTNQVDAQNLNKENNALNWVVKLFTGQPSYMHMTLEGKATRGPITKMALDVGI